MKRAVPIVKVDEWDEWDERASRSTPTSPVARRKANKSGGAKGVAELSRSANMLLNVHVGAVDSAARPPSDAAVARQRKHSWAAGSARRSSLGTPATITASAGNLLAAVLSKTLRVKRYTFHFAKGFTVAPYQGH